MNALKKMITPKAERKPNPWILFTKRIDALLKENNISFPHMADSKTFASALKKEKPYAEWLDAEIISKRHEWLAQMLVSCPVCEENPRDDVMKHRHCIVDFATGTSLKNPVGAWMSAASTIRASMTEVKFVNEEDTSLPGTV